MILWVHSEGPLAFPTLDDAIEFAAPGDRLIVTGEFEAGTFTGIPEGKGPLVVEAPDYAAVVYLDEPVLVESPTLFVNINFYAVGNNTSLCARDSGMISLDRCCIQSLDNPEDFEMVETELGESDL